MMGEMGGALGEGVAPFLPLLGPALGGAATDDPHPEVRSNALFAMGRVAEAAGPALGAYPPIGRRPHPPHSPAHPFTPPPQITALPL